MRRDEDFDEVELKETPGGGLVADTSAEPGRMWAR
jgi:hypothetical protein